MGNENEPVFFDRVQLLENIDNDTGALKNLCRVFLDSLHPMFDDVRAAVAGKDPAKLAATAHKLKGSFANFYAERAREAAYVLERIGKEARFEAVDAALTDLENETRELARALEEELTNNDGPDEHRADETTAPSPARLEHSPEKPGEKNVADFERMIRDLNNDRKLFRELGTAFLKTSGQQLNAIAAAGRAENSTALVDASNAFKGMVSGYYAERLTIAIEAIIAIGRQGNYDTVEAALEKLDAEAKLFGNELQSVISQETTEAGDALVKKKADVLDIIEELRISIETTDALKNAIQHRIDDLESKITDKNGEYEKLREEFESFREAVQSGGVPLATLSTAASSGPMLEMAQEMTGKIDALEKELFGEHETLELTRKDIGGIIGMLKDFRKMFYTLILRFGSHMMQFHQEKKATGNNKGEDWSLKKYRYGGMK